MMLCMEKVRQRSSQSQIKKPTLADWDPEAILRDVGVGLSGSSEIIADRRGAIRRAIRLAGKEDVVVIAGKGHEDYQIVGSERLPFDDRVEALSALRELGART